MSLFYYSSITSCFCCFCLWSKILKLTHKTLIDNYTKFLSTDIYPKVVICHDVERAIPSTLKSEPIKPSIVIFGNSKRPKWYRLRNLSDKLIDKLDSAVIVYYSRKS